METSAAENKRIAKQHTDKLTKRYIDIIRSNLDMLEQLSKSNRKSINIDESGVPIKSVPKEDEIWVLSH